LRRTGERCEDVRTDLERLSDGLEAINRCAAQAERGRTVLDSDPLIQIWMVRRLEILGEACRALSAQFRAARPNVPWSAIHILQRCARRATNHAVVKKTRPLSSMMI
jgi:uncharacterized protein with HEPN domain